MVKLDIQVPLDDQHVQRGLEANPERARSIESFLDGTKSSSHDHPPVFEIIALDRFNIIHSIPPLAITGSAETMAELSASRVVWKRKSIAHKWNRKTFEAIHNHLKQIGNNRKSCRIVFMDYVDDDYMGKEAAHLLHKSTN